jgi:hypothetical protein
MCNGFDFSRLISAQGRDGKPYVPNVVPELLFRSATQYSTVTAVLAADSDALSWTGITDASTRSEAADGCNRCVVISGTPA